MRFGRKRTTGTAAARAAAAAGRAAAAGAFLISSAAPALQAYASPFSGWATDSTPLPSEILIACILTGAVLFAITAAYLFLRGARRARRAGESAAQETAALRQQLAIAQSIMTAEPQALIVWEKDETPQLVTYSLDPAMGVPSKPRNLLRFASWLEREAAIDLEQHFHRLRERGEAFGLVLKTLSGAPVEAEGRASGSCHYLKFRDPGGRRLELANLINQQRSLGEDLAAKKALFDAMPIPVWFRNADGKLQWVNRAYITAVALPRQEDVLNHQIELLESRQRKSIDAALASGEIFRMRLQTIVAGGRRTFDAIAVPLGGASAGAAIDVAPLESARGELGRQMAAHARTLDRMATAVAIFGPDQRLSYYNRAYPDFWRMETVWLDSKPALGEILDRLRQSRQLPEQADYRGWRAAQLKAYENRETGEDWWHLPDGRTVHVVADQRPDGGLTFLYDDVTEKLAMESRYNALINVQRETLDNLGEGVAVFASNGRLQLYNPAFAAIWRLEPQFLGELPHADDVIRQCRLLHDEDGPWEAVKQALTGVYDKRQTFGGQLNRSDGSVIAYAGLPLPDGGTLLTYIDITDSKRVELALMERNEALEAADRLKNSFLSHVSYELRTPLTNIIGFAELLAGPHFGALNARQREYLGDIRASSITLLAIINDILDMASIDAGAIELKLAPVAVRDLMHAAELGVRERLQRSGLKLDIAAAPDTGKIVADEKRLIQVLYNLLSNAIGFSTEGATITLTCRREEDRIAFTVQDTGCGIPEEYQDAVFDRFETRPQGSRHRGAGLGLSLVKSLVELHGGEVKLRSAPGIGTTVTVLLPEQGSRRIVDGRSGMGVEAAAPGHGIAQRDNNSAIVQ